MKRIWFFSLFARSRHFILHLLYKSSWLYIIFVYKVQNRAKVSWNMTCLTNGQAIKRDNHQKEKSFMLVWQKPSKWSKWWWKEDFFKSNHSMLVEAWTKLFTINDWWSLLDDLILLIIHQWLQLSIIVFMYNL